MSKKKDAILYILQYLYMNTDDENGVTNSDIINHLEGMGISLNERSIKPNIDSINECFENAPYIEVQSYMEDGKKKFRLIERPLELEEIEMLVSALEAAKSFSKSDVRNLKAKLYALLGGKQYEKVIPALSSDKSRLNERGIVSWSLEVINKAIAEKRKIKIIYRGKTTSERNISPYKLHTSRYGLYILGKCDEHEGDISRFRIDRIEDISLSDEASIPCKNYSELEDIINFSKDMSFGEKGMAVFIYTKKIEKVIWDRYGSDVKTYTMPDGRMKISVEDYFSDTFLGWIFSLGSDIEVVGSKTLLKLMKDRVSEWSARL